MLNAGAGDWNTFQIFTARDFVFSDDDDQPPTGNIDQGQADEPETLESVRQAALKPPRGLFGGGLSSPDESWRLFLEDSPLVSDNNDGQTGTDSSTPNTHAKEKSKKCPLSNIYNKYPYV